MPPTAVTQAGDTLSGSHPWTMHPGYMHRAPVSMNTPLRSLTFPGCVTLGKSLPLSEPRVPLLVVKIAFLLSREMAFLLSLRQYGHSSEMWAHSTSGPFHALFCWPGSPFPKGLAPAHWPTLLSCSVCLHSFVCIPRPHRPAPCWPLLLTVGSPALLKDRAQESHQ